MPIISKHDLDVIANALAQAEAGFHNLPAGFCDRSVLDLIDQAKAAVAAATVARAPAYLHEQLLAQGWLGQGYAANEPIQGCVGDGNFLPVQRRR